MRVRIAHPARRAPVLVFAAALMLCAGREATAQPAPATPREAPAPVSPKVVFRAPHVHVWTRLTYERRPGAEACLDEAAFRLMAGDEEDPFAPDPQGIDAGELRVVVAKSPEGFVAQYAWTGSPDVRVPEHRIAVAGHTWRQCFDALSALALAVSVQHGALQSAYAKKYAPGVRDRLLAACPAPKPEPVATPPACFESPYAIWPQKEPPVRPDPDPAKPLERLPVAVRISAAIWPELIASGWYSFGITAGFGARLRAFSLDFEVHGDPSLGTQATVAGPVRFARVSGALVLCAHAGIFAACGVADAGRLVFPDHVAYLPPDAFYGAAGARASLEIPLELPHVVIPRLYVLPALDVRAPIRAAPYTKDNYSVFAAAAPGMGFAVGLLAELPR